MRLSEAIKLGSITTRQSNQFNDGGGGCCAIGAANNAMGVKWEGDTLKRAEKFWPYLRNEVDVPTKYFKAPLSATISYLNDSVYGLKWTREAIADWVEKLENEHGWTGTEDIKEQVPVAAPTL